ncbi:glycosyltransferase family 2 protein [Clostridium gasigenes]|uniref:Glycosyltransferase family 2 protein n=1 Tax=Clostridium gasigenes TaxID=94869 RepID=A0A7X0S9H2_9CLOT|nr:glycosyltransferase family 2 protein [Clostridium gasigenes]MBB6713526.1 glycosyltransferase family 2 protein [Clostridium gasigenes]
MEYKKDVCAIVITYNPDKDMALGMNSLLKQADNIIIVDNGSEKGQVSFLKKICSENKIDLIENNTNVGIAKALNIGIKEAIARGYKWILTLDQDSVLTDGMIDKMFSSYEQINNKDEVMIIAPKNIEKEKFSTDIILDDKVIEVLTEITSGNLVKSEVFDKIGFFEEKLFIDLVDHEFCLRINKHGFKIVKVLNAVLLHSLGETKYNNFFGKKVSTSNHSALRRYYMSRNRIYIWKNYSKDFPKWIKMDKKLFLSEILRIILFEKKKTEKIRMIIRGLMDGKNKIYGKYCDKNKGRR